MQALTMLSSTWQLARPESKRSVRTGWLGSETVGLGLVEQCANCSFVAKNIFIVNCDGITFLGGEVLYDSADISQAAAIPLSVVVNEAVTDDVEFKNTTARPFLFWCTR